MPGIGLSRFLLGGWTTDFATNGANEHGFFEGSEWFFVENDRLWVINGDYEMTMDASSAGVVLVPIIERLCRRGKHLKGQVTRNEYCQACEKDLESYLRNLDNTM